MDSSSIAYYLAGTTNFNALPYIIGGPGQGVSKTIEIPNVNSNKIIIAASGAATYAGIKINAFDGSGSLIEMNIKKTQFALGGSSSVGAVLISNEQGPGGNNVSSPLAFQYFKTSDYDSTYGGTDTPQYFLEYEINTTINIDKISVTYTALQNGGEFQSGYQYFLISKFNCSSFSGNVNSIGSGSANYTSNIQTLIDTNDGTIQNRMAASGSAWNLGTGNPSIWPEDGLPDEILLEYEDLNSDRFKLEIFNNPDQCFVVHTEVVFYDENGNIIPSYKEEKLVKVNNTLGTGGSWYLNPPEYDYATGTLQTTSSELIGGGASGYNDNLYEKTLDFYLQSPAYKAVVRHYTTPEDIFIITWGGGGQACQQGYYDGPIPDNYFGYGGFYGFLNFKFTKF